MVNKLPRDVSDHFAIDVHIKRQNIHRSSFLIGVVKKSVIKSWLSYLIPKPLFKHYKVTVDEDFLNEFIDAPMEIEQDNNESNVNDDNIEKIEFEDALVAQQHTLLWNEDKYLKIAPAEHNVPKSLLFDEHAEELLFPSIYLGEFRSFREGFTAKPFQISSSEIRRKDRRACTPHHLLYMAMKIMRLRVRDSLSVAFKHVGKNCSVTREQVESEEYVNLCIEHNISFLKIIPNFAYYWAKTKKDLFAMLRQLGKPTLFLTVSANETGWPDLIKTLCRLKK